MAELTTGQQARLDFVNQYNRGPASKSRQRSNVPGGTAIGLLYLQLDILTEQQKLLSAESVDTLLQKKIGNIKNNMETNLTWLNKAIFVGVYLVPSSIPGDEFETSYVSREWKLAVDSVCNTSELRFQVSILKTVPANEVVAVAVVRLTETFHGTAHSDLMDQLISSYNVVDDIDLFGQIILPTSDTDFKVRVESRLRCDGMQEEVEIPDIEDPVPPIE